MNSNINNKLEKIKTKSLSSTEKDTLWQGISHDINQENNLSFFSLLFSRKVVFNIAIAILVIFGGFIATVQAADRAKPGDKLYALDRAVENIQITFASPANKDKLKIKFSQERASEIQGVIKKNIDEDFEFEKDKNKNSNVGNNVGNIEESSHDALKYIIKVRNELFEKNNQIAVDDLDILLESVQASLATLPDNMKVDVEIEEENNKAEFRINFKDEDGQFKIKYKSAENNKNNRNTNDKEEEDEDENEDIELKNQKLDNINNDEEEDEDENEDDDKDDKEDEDR
ncbi:MAG: hypothetical protein WCS88_01060 [Patescibacteria group bacterium]|jgi:hypothetical protein